MRQRRLVRAAAIPIALLALTAQPRAARAGTPPPRQYIVDTWRRSAGLPQNYVYAILQGRDGYLWIGTRSGLARFDGIRFTTFDDRRPGQLKESEVWALAESPDGSLWVGTYGGGVSRLKDGKFTTFGPAQGLPSPLVQALAAGADGSVWVGTAAGLARLRDGHVTVFGIQEGLPGLSVTDLHVDRRGVVWVGTNRGLASFAGGRFTNHAAAHPSDLAGTITAMAGDGDEGLWVAVSETGGPNDGLRFVKQGTITTYTTREGLPSGVVMSLAIGKDGTVWAGTSAGLARRRGERFETCTDDVWGVAGVRMLERVSHQGLPALAFDREDSLWFGTQLEGLGRLRRAPLLNVTGGPADERDVDVRTMFEDRDGAMWLGTARDVRRLTEHDVAVHPLPPGLEADAITDGGDGSLLVGSLAGLYTLRHGRLERSPILPAPQPRISVLFRDAAGQIWIGTRSDGAYRYAGGKLVHYTSRDGLLGDQVRAIAQDRHGAIWFGTRGGGVSRLGAGRFTTFGPLDGLAGPDVQALLVTADDTAWVATRQGLSRIQGGRIARITAQQGLPANYFYQILEDGGDLWLTSAQGVTRVEKRLLHAVADGTASSLAVRSFGEESGLGNATLTLVHQATAWRAADGRLWFATTRGAAVIDPRAVERNLIPPPVHIEEVLANRRVHAVSGGMTLQASEREIEIHYAALSLVDPARVTFRRKLEGFDPDWVDAGSERLAHYTNLPHGSYRFRVVAANNDGVWNETGASLAFRVLPRWYERGLVRLSGLALAALTILGLHRLRLRRLRVRERVLSQRVQERTHDLQRLTSDLEDRIRARTRELAEANTDLLSEKERLAVTLRSIGDGVIATDVDGSIMLMNRVAEDLTGRCAADAVGRPFVEVFRVSDRDTRTPLPDPARRALAEGVSGIVADPCVLDTPEGRETLVAVSTAPIRDPASRVVGAVLVFRDVTERERIEGQLRNTQKLEALGVLAGGIAHDFNNLLTGIFGFVDLARANAGNPDVVRDSTGQAMGVLDKARGLTRQLLTFSKAGEPVRKAVGLGPLVEEAVRFVLAGSNLVVDLDVSPDLWPCQVDEQQIAQVVDNLLINARQAMPAGGTVWVQLGNVPCGASGSAGPCVRLSVQDEGPGIPRELWTRVFDPFFTTKAGGTGLGLAMVYSIVRRHGGHVEVGTARAGKGARLDVYLPAVPGAAQALRPPDVESAAIGQGLSGRILVMDDEDHVRSVARAALTRLGYVVLLARDDQEAMAIAERHRDGGETIDAAILDLTIPGGAGGVDALRRLRTVIPGLSAIASSGYSADAIMARPADFGFDAALPKPYTLAEIRAIVTETLARRGSRLES